VHVHSELEELNYNLQLLAFYYYLIGEIMKTYAVESNLSGIVTVYYTNVQTYAQACALRDNLKNENPKRVYYVKKEI
jgi:hypothetical protein